MIPKIIHQTWRDQNLPVPAGLPESWPLFQAKSMPIEKAEFARYLILHHFGGIYAVIATECVGPLGPRYWLNRTIAAPKGWVAKLAYHLFAAPTLQKTKLRKPSTPPCPTRRCHLCANQKTLPF